MISDPAKLNRNFLVDDQPDWVCPRCTKGVLHIDKETFHQHEPVRSRNHDHDAWDPEWTEYVFATLLKCSNANCSEVVALTGTGGVDYFHVRVGHTGELEECLMDFFTPMFFEPPLRFFDIPENCPRDVQQRILSSFRLVFAEPASAVNNLRIAVEELLTQLKVKRFENRGGKRKPLALHRRIDALPTRYSSAKEYLFALKWIGNEGSHAGTTVEYQNVIQAYELFEHVLEELFVKTHQKMRKFARSVNKKKGLPKK